MADAIFEPEISRSLKRLKIKISHPVAIECKKETGTSLHFDRLNDDQKTALMEFEMHNFTQKMLVSASVGGQSRFKRKTGFDFIACPKGVAYVLVNFRATKKAAGKDIPKGTNRCFAVNIFKFLEGQSKLSAEGRRSFPYSWFDENAIELDRIKWEGDKGNEYGWDLLPLWN
jgi:hypothetical protein